MFIGNTKSNRGSFVLQETCTHCKSHKGLNVSIQQDIFWLGLPLFPSSKRAIINCIECKKNYSEYNLPLAIQHKIQDQKKKFKAPIWSYLLLIIMIVMFPIIFIRKCNSTLKNNTLINTIQKNDVITFEDSGSYYRAKVYEVRNDSVYVVLSINEVTKIKYLPQLSDEYFGSNTVVYSKEDLKNLNTALKIYDIKRTDK